MYTPLFVKTNYSLLSSLLKIDDILDYCVSKKISSCAISDTNMYGVMEFIKKANNKKIKPIIGLTIKMDLHDIVLYAENYKGYQHLMKLSTIQNEKEVKLEDLKTFSTHLIAVLPYESYSYHKEYEDIYSNLYLGYSSKPEEDNAKTVTSNIVFFKEALYMRESDEEILKYLYMIRDGKTVSDTVFYETKNKSLIVDDLYEYSDTVGLKNTNVISELCNIEFPHYKNLLPDYLDQKDVSSDEYLFELSKAGLKRRLNKNIPMKYQKRLSYELGIITKMGFSNYFLVVYDFIKYAKKNHILVGPGRGSAAGSLVSYCLGITDIDPLEYDLLFERFLNPERVSMPDIDTDFPDDKRDQVIEYVTEKYGRKHVSGIVTFGTLGPKQVIRDVGRVLNVPIYKLDMLSKFIPILTKDTLVDIYQKNPTFKIRIDSDLSLKKMYNIASLIEGFPRHTSSHAAGIVMCKEELDNIIPLTYSEGMYLTSYSMDYLEDLGLLKMDFLGLKNLSLIANVIKDVEKNSGEKIDFNEIPLDDKLALGLFTIADTSGIFQFESTGMRAFLKRLRPNTFEDIFAAIALFRPGPAVNIDTYIKRKHKEEEITYLDPVLEPILKNTYGIFVYQEQIMQVANLYAGYSLGEADILRRAMSKKNKELLKSEEEKFLEKSMDMGHDETVSKKIFEFILHFAGYGFNRSHSVAYALIAYKMAYLKAHYPLEFFSNLLSNVIGSESKTKEYIREAKSRGIDVIKPDIRYSENRYVVHDDKIVFPLSNIKSVGIVASRSIIEARDEGEFKDIYDIFSRLHIKGIGKKTLETLIYADCFDYLGINKKTLIENFDHLYNYAELTKDLDPSFVNKPELNITKEFELSFLLEKEQEIFGMFLSGHPTTFYQKNNPEAISIHHIEQYFNKTIDLLCLVEKVKVIETKKKDKMAFLTGSDDTGLIDFTLFPKVYEDYASLAKGDLIKVRGRVEKRFDQYQIIVDKITPLIRKEELDEEE